MNKLLSILLLLTYFQLQAQDNVTYKLDPSIRNLEVGDAIPELMANQVIYHSSDHIRINDFTDELVIIDFWATNCSGCVANMPKVEALQNQFEDQLRIIPVTYEKKELVKAFWEKNKYTRDIDIPIVVEDSLLASHFKHRGLPHYVWIHQGIVRAITAQEYVNEENISYILDGNIPQWPVKRDMITFDYDQPLTAIGVFTDDTFPFSYAAAVSYKAEAKTKFGVSADSVKKTQRVYMVNVSVVQAYFIAWTIANGLEGLIRPSAFLTPNQVVLEVQDPSSYFFERSEEKYMASWREKNTFCFESVFPDQGQTESESYGYFIQDMDRLLGLSGRWERRNVRCLVLKEISAVKESNPGTVPPREDEEKIDIRDLLYSMNNEVKNPPVFDERLNKKQIEIRLDKRNYADIESINKAMQQYGYQFVEQNKEVDQLVISETGKVQK